MPHYSVFVKLYYLWKHSKKTENPILRYVWTGLISASAVVAYLVIALFFLSLFNQRGGIDNLNNWKTYTSQEGNFSVLFPGDPKEATQSKLFLKVHAFVCDANRKTSFLVSYTDFPEKLHVGPTGKLYDDARNGGLGKDGKLLQEKTITIDGFPGREIQAEKNDGKVFFVDRYFLAANRLYQVAVVVPKQNQTSTNISHFLDSFSLLKKNVQ